MITLITVLTTVVAKNEHLDEQLRVKIDCVLGVNLTASNSNVHIHERNKKNCNLIRIFILSNKNNSLL